MRLNADQPLIDLAQSAGASREIGARPTTGESLLLFQWAYQARGCGLTGMRTRVTDGTEARDPGAKTVPPSWYARSLIGNASLSMPTVPVGALRCYLRQDYFS